MLHSYFLKVVSGFIYCNSLMYFNVLEKSCCREQHLLADLTTYRSPGPQYVSDTISELIFEPKRLPFQCKMPSHCALVLSSYGIATALEQIEDLNNIKLLGLFFCKSRSMLSQTERTSAQLYDACKLPLPLVGYLFLKVPLCPFIMKRPIPVHCLPRWPLTKSSYS